MRISDGVRLWSRGGAATCRTRARVIAGGILGTIVLAAHFHVHATVAQIRDLLAYGEIASWRDGLPTVPPTVCGIGYYTHYPMLAAYAGFFGECVGIPAPQVVAAGMAVSAGLLVLLLTIRRSVRAGLALTVALLASLIDAPGYGSWLSYVIDCSWAFAAVFLIGAAGLARRPLWPMAAAVLFASWTTVLATFICAGMVAGVLVSVHGWSRTTLRTGLVAVVVFCAGFGLHLLQVWCHFGWDWSRVVADYLTGSAPENVERGYKASATARLAWGVPLSARLPFARQWIAQYWNELVTNAVAPWTTPGYWAGLLVAFGLVSPTSRSLAGAAIMVAGAASTAVIMPGYLAPHLHYLPRYLLIMLLGVLICLAAGTEREPVADAVPPPDSPPPARPGAGPTTASST